VLLVVGGATWVFDGSVWSDVAHSGPVSRTAAAAASLRGDVVLFGGTPDGDKTQLGDTWTWTTHWTEVPDGGAPLAREETTFAGPEQPDNVAPAAYATVATLASSQASPANIVADGVNVYWTNTGDGTVKSAPASGGTVVTRASNQAGPKGLSLGIRYDTGTSPPTPVPLLVWTNSTDGTLAQVPVAGGTATTFLSGQNSPGFLAPLAEPGSDYVYWMNDGDDSVRSPGKTLGTGLTTPGQVVFQGNFETIYWTDSGAGTLSECDWGGSGIVNQCTPTVLKTGGALGLAVDQGLDANVYYSVVTPATVSAKTSSIVSLAIGKGYTPTTLVSGLANPAHVVIDGTNVYFTDTAAGTVMTVSKTGGYAFALASGENAPAALAVDASNVYWIDGAGNVRKVAK
jgi:hypothetical protein